jgi:hypothetical protein
MYVYVLVPNGAEWEDLTIYLTEEEAIMKSKMYPRFRVEIFHQTALGFRPQYKYYSNGELCSYNQ